MKWYTLLIFYGMDPDETEIKAESEEEAFKEARKRHGNDVVIKLK